MAITTPPRDDVLAEAHGAPLDAFSLGRGLAALRIFFGVILFSNGIAKLFSFTGIGLGPYDAFLIDRDFARAILADEGARAELPLIPTLVNDLILPNWGLFQWVVTALEIGVGALLIVGLATRGAALLGLGQQLFLAGLYASSNRWAFEQPHEYVPLIILALVPAGRVWGLDARVFRARPALRRWPF